MADDADALRVQLERLTERVAALESSGAARPAHPGLDPDTFWALSGLREHLDADGIDSAVMLLGDLTLPTGEPAAWQQTVDVAGLLESSWGERASVFQALGHPVRLELLKRILSGTRSTAELAAIDTLGTTGQLHHHLRLLLAAGWLRQSGRAHYEVPVSRIVPLLVCLAGAER